MKEKLIKKNRSVVEGTFNGQKVKIESGELAQLANSAVVVTVGETTVLATVVSKTPTETPKYFPLKIDYEERFYAGGTIGGSRFTRREGRPTDIAVINARIIDHAVRPLFPKDYWDDTHVVVTVLSIDGKNDPGLVGFLAATVALSTSGIPFAGPIVALKIRKTNGELVVGFDEGDESDEISLTVSYLNDGNKVQSIESHSHIVPEEEILNAVNEGAKQSLILFNLLNEFINKSEVIVKEYTPSWVNKNVISKLEPEVLPLIEEMHKNGISYKSAEWSEKLAELSENLSSEFGESYEAWQIRELMSEVQKNWVRDLVINKKERIDGRKFDEVRELSAKVAVLPRVHGSALFSRGITQALTVSTLASFSQKLLIQGMAEEKTKRYIHHYNFPPYSTGETGRMGGFNRRAIGHGALAEKALNPVLPTEEDFAYTIRNVTEIMSSNGSTSMAATCGSSLALMDAGVPIKAHVAGIGVGLMVDSDVEDSKASDFILLTDIVGYEDFAGFMDFKMTGTKDGVTAIQMELKLKGLPLELLESIFEASKKARMQVLDVMNKAITNPRTEISEYAPKVEMVEIKKDEIGQVIGSGGVVIKGIMEEMSVEIDIEEKGDIGMVSISSTSIEDVKRAKDYIKQLLEKPEVGKTYEGEVKRVEDYGVFVEILPKQEGLLHVSAYSYGFVKDMKEKVKIGDRLKVVVTDVENGRIALSRKPLLEKPEGYIEPERKPRSNGGFSNKGRSSNGRRDGSNSRNGSGRRQDNSRERYR